MKRIPVVLITAFVAGEACAITLEGRVVGVYDGDTVTVLDANRQAGVMG